MLLAALHESDFWHFASFATLQRQGRYRTNNGQKSAQTLNRCAAFDPTATLAVHCGNGFDAGFSPLSKG
jgi:hypothetical protein